MKTESGQTMKAVTAEAKRRVVNSKTGYVRYKRIVHGILAISDAIAALFSISLLEHFHPSFFGPHGATAVILLPVFVLITYIVFSAFSLYNISILSGGAYEYGRVFSAVNTLTLLSIIASFAGNQQTISPKVLVSLWLSFLICFVVDRFIVRRISFLLRKQPGLRQRTVIVGAGPEGQAMARQWAEVPGSGVEVIGFLDDEAPVGEVTVSGGVVIGQAKDLEAVIHDYGVDSLFLADPSLLRSRLEKDDRLLESVWDVELQVGTGTSELLTSSLSIREEGFVPLIVMSKQRMSGVHYRIKTIMDYVIASVLLLLLAPLFLLFLALIKLESPGPTIYRRKTVGIGRKPFDMLKFRTMFLEGNQKLSSTQMSELLEFGKLREDPRITKVGKIMRKFSLDELPQLWNVVRGEMSLIGPRAITQAEMEKFGRWQHTRTMVKPGLTGLWQVSGRSDLTYEDRARMDVHYVRNYTIWLDLKILWLTIPAVLFSKGAY